MCDQLAGAAARGHGTRLRNGLWQMRDRILTDTLLTAEAGAVYIREFLLEAPGGSPHPTYSGNRYRGGRSRNLPIWCRLRR